MLSELQEPVEQLLLISTGRQNPNEGRLFLWYYGKPRGLGHASVYLHHPVSLEDKILICTGSDEIGLYSNDQSIRELLTGRVWYNDNPSVGSLAVSRGAVYAPIRSDVFIPDNNRGRNPDKIVRVEPDNCTDLYTHRCRITGLTGDEEFLFILDYDRLDHPNVNHPQAITVYRGGITRTLWEKDNYNLFLSINVGNNRVLLGGVGIIHEIDKSSGLVIPRYHDKEVSDAYEELTGVLDGNSFKRNIREQEDLAIGKGYKDYFLNNSTYEIAYFYQQNFSIRHLVEYQGSIVYAVGKKLFVLGDKEPAYTFRHTVTGLATAQINQLEILQGKMNLKMGARKSKSLGLSLRLAA